MSKVTLVKFARKTYFEGIMIQLEKYKGNQSRHTCPSCHQSREFVRYINTETGQHISPECGKCNRGSKCGYHLTPKMFFLSNPTLLTVKKPTLTNIRVKTNISKFKDSFPVKPDYISHNLLIKGCQNSRNNSLVKFLINLFPEDTEIVFQNLNKYFIGTFDGRTCFWQIDRNRRIRTGKLITYNPETGKRLKKPDPSWVHAELKKRGEIPKNFKLLQCFFGEHLLIDETRKQIAIVEAEKTALIASIYFPEFIWLACGSRQSLTVEKLKIFIGRNIVLYPDADSFKLWEKITWDARKLGLEVRISTLIEKYATENEKQNGFDLADYLILQQQNINQYNFKLKQVLNNKSLLNELETILDEQKAILIIDGETPEKEAESQVLNPSNVRKIITYL